MAERSTGAVVRVAVIVQHPDGSFTVRGTIDRRDMPVVLRGVADQIEENDRG